MREVIGELERLRSRGWTMLVSQRVAVVVAWAVGILLCLVLIDYALRLPAALRLACLLAGLGGLGLAVATYLRAAVAFHPSLTQLAMRVERSLPALSGRLASSVEFAASGLDDSNALARRSVDETQRRLSGESVFSVVAPRRTLRDVAILVVVLIVAGGVASANPSGAGIGVRRVLLPLGDARWPARTGVASLMGDVKVHPRGQPLALRAEAVKGDILNMRVNARYRTTVEGERGDWVDIVLTHQGDAVYERLVDTEADRIEFHFFTADHRSAPQVIDLNPPPAVRAATLRTTPPSYAAEAVAPLAFDLGPGIDERAEVPSPILAGSSASLELELNKPLPVPAIDDPGRDDWIAATLGWEGDDPPTLATDGESRWIVRWTVAQSRDLVLGLEDEHGLTNTDDIAYRITTVPDSVPSATILVPQADEAVLPTAIVPIEAEGRDDVGIAAIALEAVRFRAEQEDGAGDAVWSSEGTETGPVVRVESTLDLGTIEPAIGDVIEVVATAEDAFEINGTVREPSRSAPRRLRIIDDMELARQLRQQLSALRQSAIRVDAQQAELIDDIIDAGPRPGVDRAQGLVGERVADQIEAIDQLAERAERNRLDDDQLDRLLDQARELLDFAGQASNRASEAIESRLRDGASEPRDPDERDEDDERLRQPADEDREVVDAQREVRDELTDLISMLDRDEDTWVMTRQIESLLDGMREVESQTAETGRETVGRDRSELSEDLSSDLDRIEQRQRELAEQARRLTDELRDRAEQLEETDADRAEAMRTAADTAEQSELDRAMERAADRIQQNQIENARAEQQQAQETLQNMLEDFKESNRARIEQLKRELASLVESIERLATIQEDELIGLAQAVDDDDFADRARAMIRLNQNTQVVAEDARATGQEMHGIARILGRAADAQGAAIAHLRADPRRDDDAEDAETRSLDLLKEALEKAKALEEQLAEQEARQKREELRNAYQAFLERQAEIRGATLDLAKLETLDRRALVESRRLGMGEEEIRTGMDDLQRANPELMESAIFTHTHGRIDAALERVGAALLEGDVSMDTTDRQRIVEALISRLLEALADAEPAEDPFEGGQQQGGGDGQSGQGEPQLIPPIAELKLLRGLQEDVYSRTRALDARDDLDDAEERARSRELGNEQRELLELGEQLLESITPGGMPGQDGGQDGGQDEGQLPDEPEEPTVRAPHEVTP